MRKTLAILAIAIMLALAVSAGNCAGLLASANGSAVGVDFPLYSAQSSTQTMTGMMQVVIRYQDQIPWTWDQSESTYLGRFPSGIGLVLDAFPNGISNLPLVAMCAVEGELEQEPKYRYDRKNKEWSFEGSQVYNMGRDGRGKFYLSIPLDAKIGTDAHCLRFYGLLKDGKREDRAFLVIFRRPKKSPLSAVVDTLRFQTELWPSGAEKPSVQYLTDLLRRAGNGGNGLVFETLIANDQARADYRAEQAQEESKPQTTEKSVTRGDYFLKFVRNGRDFCGKIWIKKPETGAVFGPFQGPTITQNNAVLSVSLDGVVTAQSYSIGYSLDGVNFVQTESFTPGVAGATITVEVTR